MGACQTCGAALTQRVLPQGGGRPRKFCSERCRKAQYSRPCVDCGKPMNGSDGCGPRAPLRCTRCNGVFVGEANRIWTRESILAAVRKWAVMYGSPPAMPDWDAWFARNMLHDEDRARRSHEVGSHWPSVTTVVRAFGTWNAAIAAAGFEPRAPHGGGNQQRKRSVSEYPVIGRFAA